jgi:putative lipoprotein (rSAM/lipoprotein system)
MKRKWIRKILGGFSLTSALFIFQACYGTPQDLGLDFFIEGQVKAHSSGIPIKGIKVSVADNVQYGYTDSDGKFSFYTEMTDNVRILFEDIDLNQNGTYTNKDTVLTNVANRVFLNIRLKEK